MGFRGRGTVLIATAAPTESIDVGDPFVTGGSGLAADAGHQHEFDAAALVDALAPGGPADLSGDYVNLGASQTVAGQKTLTNIFRVKAGAPVFELDAMTRILGGAHTATLADPQHGLGVIVYNEGTDPGLNGIVYAGATVQHQGGPAAQHKVWGVVSKTYNESGLDTTVGVYSTTRVSGGASAWAWAGEVWDTFDPGTGEVGIGGGTVAGTRGIWVQPGGVANGPAGWSIGVDVEIGPLDNATIGLRLRGSQQGAPPAWAGYYLQCLDASTGVKNFGITPDGSLVFGSNERTTLSKSALTLNNDTGGASVGLIKFDRAGVLVAQSGIDTTDRWTVFNNAGTPLATVDGTIAAGETALWVRSGGALVRVKAGAAGTGPGGSGQALYI
jgi:hypothetical protein